MAEGLASRDGKRVAYIDTERGTEFYALRIPERKVHPEAFDFDRLVTRSLMETLEAVETLDPAVHSVVVIDSVTHLWEAAKATYTGKMTSKGGIPVQAWGQLKKPYKKLMSLLLDGNYHAIICGREGVVMEDDEEGELKVVGAKMKAEGETPHEPHVLGRMQTRFDESGGHIIRVFFEKDRSGILTGKTIEWPNYATIAPLVEYLSGSKTQGKVGTEDEAAERDIAARDELQRRAEVERQLLFEQIRAAVSSATTADALRAAWSLTSGKKTKLGDGLFEQLSTLKDARKVELLDKVA